ncbi:response regulator transcription factor [Actinoplanes derwentensis]|uniref:DNA-binding response regulator, OmpR family, contains REC and winged-helix (WHTH) domain n=1 Tax=Actinoplanes derwentensis TaxID=113562 RepID=A0A1H1YT82_9ACTN|nr:response regulator transcription factor [Actinoplanes derwentensis]GID81278.1 DNA-binding response regulator [Actinoplanes derwentensis]SDT24627.1 DNA-binding response regulator, OmpR family, contains REC and winged-helix (wHTH) domain [Actinoplanes derwentensis]
MCAKVLVAEDDPRQAEVIRRYLVNDGHETTVVHDGRAALETARQIEPDLIVLDVMMPELDGLHVCRTLRAESDVLVLMLTARRTEDDLLLGLELGADDYLVKPYSPRELMARIRTLLRRRPVVVTTAEIREIGGVTVNQTSHQVTVDGAAIECTRGEFAILSAMAGQPDRVFSRAQLLHHTRGIDRSSTERTIDMHVMNLRRKIGSQRLVTVYGIGYKLVAEA